MDEALAFLRALLHTPLPRIDLGVVHPALAGADLVELALVGFVSWSGGRFMTGGRG